MFLTDKTFIETLRAQFSVEAQIIQWLKPAFVKELRVSRALYFYSFLRRKLLFIFPAFPGQTFRPSMKQPPSGGYFFK